MNNITSNKNILILHHGDCPDGFGAAWAAWKKFGDRAEYIGLSHQDPPLQDITGKEIYFLDFSYTADVIKNLVKNNLSVTIIDHHVSREEDVKSATHHVFDIDHSGSVLSWIFFHPNKKVPRLLEYIEDRDIGNIKLQHSREVCLSLDRFNMDFAIWDNLAAELESDEGFLKHMNEGKAIADYRDRMIQRLIETSKVLVEFEGYQCYCVNAPHIFASAVGYALVKEKPPIAIIWSYNDRGMRVSLRSHKDDPNTDVAKIAAKYGGGGHRMAAAFSLKESIRFPWKEIKNE